MGIIETYKIYKSGGFKDSDMRRAFERSIKPMAVVELIKELDKVKQELADLKASLPKVRADAARGLLKDLEHGCTGWAKDGQGNVYWQDSIILAWADNQESEPLPPTEEA